MFNKLNTPLSYLSSRRSGKARDMIAPGPDADALATIIELAARTPDHGKLFPWRFVHITDRAAFSSLLRRAFTAHNTDARDIQIDAAIAPAAMAPTLIILLHAPQQNAKIPDWEQQLSTGAVAMNLLHAAHCSGFVANWITGWIAYDPIVRAEICDGSEQVAGLFFIGKPAKELEERPRPEISQVFRTWPKKQHEG
jgi:nitroreductase